MGAYNILLMVVECSHCGKKYASRLQFKAGEVWQYSYKVNDVIKDGMGENSISDKRIMAYGILEDDQCPDCGNMNSEEYDILIEKGQIKTYQLVSDVNRYVYSNDPRNYVLG